MTNQQRSSRRLPNIPNNFENIQDIVLHLEDLQRSLEDLELDVPYLPINRQSFDVSIESQNYELTPTTSLGGVIEVLGTLLTHMKHSGIIK